MALLLKLRPAAAETSSVAALLDWYDLGREVILVLERPVPCIDLIDFIESRGSAMTEHEAKVCSWFHECFYLPTSSILKTQCLFGPPSGHREAVGGCPHGGPVQGGLSQRHQAGEHHSGNHLECPPCLADRLRLWNLHDGAELH